MSIEIKGLDKLQRKLNDLQRKAEALNGEHQVPLSELFDGSFMRQYTNFDSFDDLLATGGFKVESADDFKAIPDKEWDAHISRTTKFANWQEMLSEAGTKWAAKQLGF